MNRQYIVMIGSIFDGYHFTGPFATLEEAETYADDHPSDNPNDDWNVVRLQNPEGDDK